ncbi:unnamed protein product [Caenorhabditis angaria]|uniref:Uncharacterized protein n=1 Tax=Caenorhabditis angaria TaxID=860376 RepID=A0A9P1J260_9PELO|nr:unnamed protein product [Caenorhabditis angaria]
MVNRKCTVCDNPQAPNYHFGARACKACAAFFRRSISMDQQYECQDNPANIYPSCNIYYQSRFNCRHCRLLKCFNSGMSKDLVQAKSVVKLNKRKFKNQRAIQPNLQLPHYEPPQFYQTSENEWDYETPQKLMRYDDPNLMCAEELNQLISFQPISFEPSTSETVYSDDFAENEIRSRLNSFAEHRDFGEDFQAYQTSDFYVDQCLNLNRGRKMTFTEVDVTTIFDDANCLCPFKISDLRQFDHREYTTRKRPEYTIILNYITKFPEFNQFSVSEKSILYRTAIGVDLLADQMFYSDALFKKSDVMVLTNGWFINMNPLPTPESEKFSGNFLSDDDFRKYEWWMNMKRRQWLNVVQPLKRLNLSFTEFSLFKAMIIWHHNYFKLTESGRRICERQRDLILKSLLVICADEGYDNPQLRVADLITAMSCIMIEIHEMLANYIEGTMFDMIIDPTLTNIISYQY